MAGNFDYNQKKKDTVVCWQEIDSFFFVAGNFHYDRKKKIHYDRKKKIQSSLAGNYHFFCSGGKFRLRPEKKKDTVVCWREIGSFIVVAGNFHYDRKKKDTLRPEKKRYSRL